MFFRRPHETVPTVHWPEPSKGNTATITATYEGQAQKEDKHLGAEGRVAGGRKAIGQAANCVCCCASVWTQLFYRLGKGSGGWVFSK